MDANPSISDKSEFYRLIQNDFDNRIALPISKHNRIPQKIMFEINKTFYSCFDVMI